MSASAPRTFERHRSDAAALLEPLVSRLSSGTASDEIKVGDPALTGRVLAEDAVARTPIPAFDNSQMDGYAVRVADLAAARADSPVSLPLGRTTAAGDPPGPHLPGTASPVMTGAPIPDGADAVVPVEETDPPRFPVLGRSSDPPSAASAAFAFPVAAGRFIRPLGEDLRRGDRAAAAGARVTPALIGALAAAGIRRVRVRPLPRVLLCATGDEIEGVREDPDSERGPASELAAGRIHDANTPMLRAELERLGARVVVARTGDTAAELLDAIAREAGDVDLVVTCGGISRGAFEVVRDALGPLGVDFRSVALQPGGPQGLGSIPPEALDGERAEPLPVLCFPGNPVSAALSVELFLAPILRRLAGRPAERDTIRLPLAHDVVSPEGKHQIRRGAVDAAGRVRVSAPGSHLIGELAAARLLVHIPIGVAHAPAGALVDTWRFND